MISWRSFFSVYVLHCLLCSIHGMEMTFGVREPSLQVDFFNLLKYINSKQIQDRLCCTDFLCGCIRPTSTSVPPIRYQILNNAYISIPLSAPSLQCFQMTRDQKSLFGDTISMTEIKVAELVVRKRPGRQCPSLSSSSTRQIYLVQASYKTFKTSSLNKFRPWLWGFTGYYPISRLTPYSTFNLRLLASSPLLASLCFRI